LLFHDAEFGERIMTAGANFDDPQSLEAFVIRNTRQLAMAGKLLFPIPDRGLEDRLYRIGANSPLGWGPDLSSESVAACSVGTDSSKAASSGANPERRNRLQRSPWKFFEASGTLFGWLYLLNRRPVTPLKINTPEPPSEASVPLSAAFTSKG